MRNLFPLVITFLLLMFSLPSLSELITDYKKETESESYSSPSLRRMSSGLFNKYNVRATMTCDKFPRICRANGSGGPDCCKKQCVNVMVDGLNCGECGKKCRYGEKCCGGNCVNVMFDGKNCGACHSRCKKGSFCRFGMCSYA